MTGSTHGSLRHVACINCRGHVFSHNGGYMQITDDITGQARDLFDDFGQHAGVTIGVSKERLEKLGHRTARPNLVTALPPMQE
jgi:hypothetical protein